MNIVLLAAGMGTRLGLEEPKSLVKVCERSLLEWSLRAYQKVGVKNLNIVTGHQSELLKRFVEQHKNQLSVEFKHNPDFTQGNLISLMSVLPQLKESFFLFNADHFYSPQTYAFIKSQELKNEFTVFCDFDRQLSDDDMKVVFQKKSPQRLVQNMSKAHPVFDAGYVGVTFVPQSKIELYAQTCLQVLELQGPKSSVEMVINQLAQKGEQIGVADISGSWWVEVDTPADQKSAEQILREHEQEWP